MTTTAFRISFSSVRPSFEGTTLFFDQQADGPRTGKFASLAESTLHSSLGILLSAAAPDEALPKLALDNSNVNEVESISMLELLDPTCMVYHARTMRLGNGRTHDRSQIIVNTLCDLATDGLQPLFVIMTCTAAVSLNRAIGLSLSPRNLVVL